MIQDLFDAADALPYGEERNRLIQQMARTPDEIIPIVLKVLSKPPLYRHEMAYEIIRDIGYPANATFIQSLIIHLGDPNRYGWDAAKQALANMGPDVVVPHLIEALLDQGATTYYPDSDVYGLCNMLGAVEPEFARRCCPTINYLLSRIDQSINIDVDSLLDVIEKAGEQTYVLPTLVALLRTAPASRIEEQIRRILSTFPSQDLAPYTLYANNL